MSGREQQIQDRQRANPLAMPDFAPVASGVGDAAVMVDRAPRTATSTERQNRVSSFAMLLCPSDAESDYVRYRYQWGRIVLTPALLFCGVGQFATPFGFHRDNWFRWWAFDLIVTLGVVLVVIALVNAVVIFIFRHQPRLSVTAIRLYEMCLVCGGIVLVCASAAHYFVMDMCVQDRIGRNDDSFPCIARIPLATLTTTVVFTCIVPCRVLIALAVSSVLPPLLNFIVRLAQPLDSVSMLYAKLIVTLVITGAFTVLCVKRDLAHRRRYEVELAISADNTRVGATREFVLETLETVFPAGFMSRLVRGLTVVSASCQVALGACDVGDLSLLSRELSPREIVVLLTELTRAFDASVEQQNGEKLKTLGDRFAFAVGLLRQPCSPPDAVMAATAIAKNFLRRHRAHPFVAASSVVSLRTCIGFGACTGGVVGVRSISFEEYSPALTELDALLPECPVNMVVATAPAALQCPALFSPNPVLNISLSSPGSGQELSIALFTVCRSSDAEMMHESSTIEGGNSFISGVPTVNDGSSVVQKRHAELIGAVFRWGAEVKRQAMQANEGLEEEFQSKDVLLDRALELEAQSRVAASEVPHPAEFNRSISMTDGVMGADLGSSLDSGAFMSSGGDRAVIAPLGGANYAAMIERLFVVTKVPGKVIPRRYRVGTLEQLFDDFERLFVVDNTLVLAHIFGAFFAATLVVVTATSGTTASRSGAVPLAAAGIVLSGAVSAVVRSQRERLQTWRHAGHLSLVLAAVLMVIALASAAVSKVPVLAENTIFVTVLNFGVIAACTTRFSHSVLLNVLNVAVNIFIMRNSRDPSLLVVAVYGVCSFMCIFSPLEAERSLRSGFELTLVASALRRSLCEELAVASAILHHTVPHFVADLVLRRQKAITNLHYVLPNVCVLAIRVDGFSRAACEGIEGAAMLQNTSMALANEFLCDVEECLRSAVEMSLQNEVALRELGMERSRQTPFLAGESEEHMDQSVSNVDVLVKVRAFGDKMTVFGPLMESASDQRLRTAVLAMLHAMEHISTLISEKYKSFVTTSMATYDSGIVVVLGKTRCRPNIMGVAARQADLLLRAAPDGYKGVASSLAKAMSTLQVNLPLPNCRWVMAEHSESWRVRGAGAVVVLRLEGSKT